jgi:hypothetical protein
MKKSFKSEYVPLFLLCLFHAAVNSVWILMDFSFWYSPHSVYVLTMDALAKLNHGIFVLYPLYPAVSAVFLKIFGCEYFIFSLVTSLFFIMLILSVYGICRVAGHRNAGLPAAFLISFYPIVFATSRWHDYHVPLIALLALSHFILLIADKRSSVVMWLLWACVFIFGSLLGKSTVTETLIFYIGASGGILWVFINNIRSLFLRVRKKRLIINILCLVILGTLSVLFTWNRIDPMIHIPYYLSELNNNSYSRAGQNPFLKLFAYFFNIGGRQAGNLAVLLFFAAIGPFMNRVKKYKWFLFLWMLFPLSVFTMIDKKLIYYTNSILPAFAVITAIGIMNIKSGIVKRCAPFVILLFLTQYYFLSFHDRASVEKYAFYPRYYERSCFQYVGKFCTAPNSRARKKITSLSAEISARIREYLKGNGAEAEIGLVCIANGYSISRFFPRIFIPLFCELAKNTRLNFKSVREILYISSSLGREATEQSNQSSLDEMGFGYYLSAFISGELVIADTAVHGLFDKSLTGPYLEPYYDFIGQYDVFKNDGVSLFFKKEKR